MDINISRGVNVGQPREYSTSQFEKKVDPDILYMPPSDEVYLQSKLMQDQMSFKSINNMIDALKSQDNKPEDKNKDLGVVLTQRSDQDPVSSTRHQNVEEKGFLKYDNNSEGKEAEEMHFSYVTDSFFNGKFEEKMVTERHFFKDDEGKSHYVSRDLNNGKETVIDSVNGKVTVLDYYFPLQ